MKELFHPISTSGLLFPMVHDENARTFTRACMGGTVHIILLHMPQTHHKKRGRGIPIGHRMLEWNVNSIIALDLLNLGSVDIQQCALFTCSKEWLPFQIWMMNSKWKHHVIIFPQRKNRGPKNSSRIGCYSKI